MSKEEIEIINKEWSQFLINRGVTNFFVYKPFDGYWNQKTKILVCNLETYGYEDCGITELGFDLLSQWMRDTHITKTTRYTSIFINALLRAIKGTRLNQKEIRNSYHRYDDLAGAMKNVSYMNFRKESNSRVEQDVPKIIEEVKVHKDFIRRYIIACEPSIILIGGRNMSR